MNRPLERQLAIRLLILFFAVGLVLSAPLVASAHGGEARLELNVTQASPGATIDLRGSGFEPDDTTTIMLVSAERQVLFGSATTDDHGDLTYAVLLPMDLVNGAYEVRVAGMHHVAAAPLNIVPDSSGEEEGGQRGEDEPLLAPFPTRAPDSVAATPATAPRTEPQTAVAGESSAAWILLPVGMLAVAGLALALRRRSVR